MGQQTLKKGKISIYFNYDWIIMITSGVCWIWQILVVYPTEMYPATEYALKLAILDNYNRRMTVVKYSVYTDSWKWLYKPADTRFYRYLTPLSAVLITVSHTIQNLRNIRTGTFNFIPWSRVFLEKPVRKFIAGYGIRHWALRRYVTPLHFLLFFLKIRFSRTFWHTLRPLITSFLRVSFSPLRHLTY
jgi:hypothetical protein